MRCNIPSRDLAQKLGSSICMYNKKPVWVGIEGSNITVYDLPAQNNPRRITADDPLFDISSPPLGYMNYNSQVLYLSRAAVRRSRQALDGRSLISNRLDQKNGEGKFLKVPFERLMTNQGFTDMITENYKPLEDSIKEIRGKHARDNNQCYEIAVTRSIALKINELGIINVFYKNDLVGWIKPNGNTVNVPSNDKGWIVSRYLSHVLNWSVK